MSATPTTTHPDQLFLPGQAAAPEGPVDMSMMYLMHHGFRRDLRRFAAAAEHTPADDSATWAALARRWDLLAEVLHHHHTGEDAGVWPALLERADEHERATLEAMEAEHAGIDPLLRSCAERLAALAAGGGTGAEREAARAALAVRMAEANQLLGQHLAHEETDAMAILQRHLTPEDWDRIEAEAFESQNGPRSCSGWCPGSPTGSPPLRGGRRSRWPARRCGWSGG
ncbi:hemerythrin domain-containing protein [Nocardioides sp. GY 10113]|uniref:hemerythrin domain-containing protein n=1 Tax=Nocardioides sp. GY 10113 TaxID=2569761 RepID=UPI0010A80E9A|nr:hemerythrin domain-containing protein [Nocardioides sp. GY 10113]TIC89021.1 hemerythrin domain-containing protein [Nocardioides sp. GY 10113]